MVVVGAPFDGGTSNRPGTRFGPMAIRQTDYLPQDGSRPHLALRVDALQDVRVVDAGDVEMPPGEIERALGALEEAVYAVASAGAVPLVLGGDHSIALPDATGVARHLGFGRVSMIHFDAHADTGDIEFGSLYGHGQPMRRLIESGALRGDRFLQMGLRGYWPGPETLDWMAEQDMRSYEMTEIGKRGLEACLDEAFEIALDDCDAVFLSVDIDVCDPGHAPGTGTPEPGGLSSRRAARRRPPDLPRAARRRHRRGRGLAALRPRRDHGVPRQPGVPRGALRPGRPQASASPTTPPARCWKGAEWAPPLRQRRRVRRAPVPRAPAPSWSRTAAIVEVAWLSVRGALSDAPRTTSDEVVDLAGGLISPGFTDAHVHPIQGGLERLRCDLSELSTREEYLAAIRAYADAHPDREWILGGGWAMPAFAGRHARRRPTSTRSCPTGRCSCPTATTTAPGSTAARWRSPASTASTPDPPDGRIERDADGHPTGTLHEGAMRAGVAARARAPPARTTTPR